MRKIDYAVYQKPSDFVRFLEGDTTIRIISSGVLTKKHGMKTAKGYIPMGDCTETPECKLCASGNEAKQKWTWICYVRHTKEVKILDVGAMIGDAICKIAQERKQDPQEYDLVIHRTGQGIKTNYTVKAVEGAPLTDEEKAATTITKQFLVKKYFQNK